MNEFYLNDVRDFLEMNAECEDVDCFEVRETWCVYVDIAAGGCEEGPLLDMWLGRGSLDQQG